VPLYEFECEKCHHRFEKIQGFSDPDPEKCPKCGANKVHRLLHAPAVQFKGSGWYATDYKKAGATSSKSETSASGASSDSSSSGSTDSKSASKSETKTEAKSDVSSKS
jgi:putative FmdB family regulatory protein